jgi:two-component system KDP operon response regulator KdpE
MDKTKIMIVDDDLDLRRALKLRLQANHYDTVHASDGNSAISMAEKERPSLIILDLGLPSGDSFLILKWLQERDTPSKIPVIVLTARDPQSSGQTILQAGATALFEKPVNSNQLLHAIRATLPATWSGSATQPL